MRAVKYDLYFNNVVIKETENFAEAVEWKNESGSNNYKVRLEEVQNEVSEKEKKWREYFIAKKNAYRSRKNKV